MHENKDKRWSGYAVYFYLNTSKKSTKVKQGKKISQKKIQNQIRL